MTLGELWRRVTLLIRRERLREDLDAEIQLHQELRAEANRRSGADARTASAASRRAFGNPNLIREASQDVWGGRWLDVLQQDLGYAFRTLRRSPGFTLATILTLALAIGSTTAVFSVVNGVLLRPLPFAGQDRLTMLAERSRQGGLRPPSYPTFLDWQREARAFEGLAYVRGGGQRVTGSEGVQNIVVSVVSPGFFSVLGERPLLGRLFTPDEERSGAQVAVLSYALWQRRFGGDPQILERALSLSSGAYRVVGVLPHDVAYPPWTDEQLYTPLATVTATDHALVQRGFHADCRIIGRLNPGISIEQATADLSDVARREAAAYPEFNADWTSAELIPLRDEVLGDTKAQLLMLLAAVALVLLVACVNIANLSLARGHARVRELAIRSALGAGRGRVARQLFTESALLAGGGGLLGVTAAWWAVVWLRRTGLAVVPRLDTVAVDVRVLAVAIGVVGLTAVATGLLPALWAGRSDLTESLKQRSEAATSGSPRPRLRAVLVTSEIALAVILVAGAGLLVRSLRELRAVSPGFDSAGLTTFYVSPPPGREPAALRALYFRILDAARALPGVTGVALTNFTPLSGGGLPSPVQVAGRAPDPEHDPQVWFMTVSPGYCRTMRIPVREGRDFTEADLAGGTAVLVNEAFARSYLAGSDPIGRSLTLHKAVQGRDDFGESMPATIIGIVGDVHHFDLASPAEPQVYVPFTRNVWGHITLVVRMAVSQPGFPRTLTRTVQRVDPEIPVMLSGGQAAAGPVDVIGSLASRRLDAWVLGSFGAAALLLAAIGVYGLIGYSVARRRQEIGVRVALGARRSDVLRLVVGDGMRLAVVGILVGLLGALAVTRLLAGLLYGVGASDPATFVADAALLGLVALTACYLPARRAAGIDPVTALRYE